MPTKEQAGIDWRAVYLRSLTLPEPQEIAA
jgi:hypothetical protein